MPCKRRLHRLRSCHWQAVVIVIVLFLGIFLAYRTLNGQDAGSHIHGNFPTLDQGYPHTGLVYMRGTQTRMDVNQPVNLDKKVLQEVLSLLYPLSWKLAKETDEVAIVLKDKMLELDLPSRMSCQDILNHQIHRGLGQSKNKFVEILEPVRHDTGSFGFFMDNQGQKGSDVMVIKSQADDIQTKVKCMKQTYDSKFCNLMGNYLLMREIFLLHILKHPGLIRVHGYCIRGDTVSADLKKKGLMLVTEMGVPLIPSLVVTMSWPRRLQLARDVASLLAYLHSSPLGSVGLPKVQQKDFVVVNQKSVKLTDLDEADLEERACSSAADCFLQGSDVGVPCDNGQCVGLNLRTNLRVMGSYVLEPLLRNPPSESQSGVNAVLDRIRHLDIAPKDLLSFLESLAKNYSVPEDSAADRPNNIFGGLAGGPFADTQKDVQRSARNPQPLSYIRMDSSNFPGRYDYPCPDSRVMWGCVMTYSSLHFAMNRCSWDPGCKSFVVFSAKPEVDNRMTVVFKSDSQGQPHTNLGTTLFIKQKPQTPQQTSDSNVEGKSLEHEGKKLEPRIDENRMVKDGRSKMENNQENDGKHPAEKEQTRGVTRASEEKGENKKAKEDPWVKVLEIQQCVQHSQTNQEEAFRSREKRLMALMGFKGRKENDWKRSVKIGAVTSFSHLQPLTEEGSRGGSMIIHFNTSSAGHFVTRARFMVEESGTHNHVALALVYHIDRLLGLYHTPPAVEGFLRLPVVNRFLTNETWKTSFDSLISPDGTLRGLYMASAPKVIKKSDISLKPLSELVSEVKAFDRTQKKQLEYVLMWWLGHISKPGNFHYGYRGHLIHLDGDQAFQELGANYDNYFHHCQFPNVVYKMLACFRCRQTKICYFAQEVIRKVEASGFKLSSLHIGNLTEQDYTTLINKAASRIIDIVDKCIQKFGRETVLY